MFLPYRRILVGGQMNDGVAFRWRPELREDVAGTFAYVARQRRMAAVCEQFNYARPQEPGRTGHEHIHRTTSRANMLNHPSASAGGSRAAGSACFRGLRRWDGR